MWSRGVEIESKTEIGIPQVVEDILKVKRVIHFKVNCNPKI